MATSSMTALLHHSVTMVWEVVTSLEQYTWRSDLKNVKVLDEGRQFIEYTKEGAATFFTVTAFEPCKRWEFDMENENMKGHWTGLFSGDEHETTIHFTENVTANKFFLKPFVRRFLQKQQAAYLADLQTALVEKEKF